MLRARNGIQDDFVAVGNNFLASQQKIRVLARLMPSTVLCYIMCVIILCWKHRFAFLNYANPVSAHASGAMQQVKQQQVQTTQLQLEWHYILSRCLGVFIQFHYVLVILMYHCKLKLNLAWKVVIIYI